MRKAVIERKTSETEVTVEINLDGQGKTELDTGLPFLEHMLEQIGRHGMIDLKVIAKGDLHIDNHHTIEDIGISLGEACLKAVGDKEGINRYGFSYVPLDEALSRLRPVIIFPEISHVTRNRDGVFVSERNSKSLSKKIKYIIQEYENIRKKMALNKLPTKKLFLEELKEIIK